MVQPGAGRFFRSGSHRLERVRVPTGSSKNRASAAGPSTTSLSSLDELTFRECVRLRLTSRTLWYCAFAPLHDGASLTSPVRNDACSAARSRSIASHRFKPIAATTSSIASTSRALYVDSVTQFPSRIASLLALTPSIFFRTSATTLFTSSATSASFRNSRGTASPTGRNESSAEKSACFRAPPRGADVRVNDPAECLAS
mmetsp:Transcript_11352/g.48416  ORF Transcript_11352/g.48416 Transcript_11352/m.48416 type:complete len:200 (-) Transcript_11352:1290-1889(-)